MFQQTWEETIASSDSLADENLGQGYLLQIHPLRVSGSLIDLAEGQSLVGRENDADIVVADGSVSRRHAIIEHTGAGYVLTDLGSTNGTCVNEERVQTATLDPGDRVQFGSFIFKFLTSNHIELQYHEAVYSMMTRDGLTGTLNKRSFTEILRREFQRAVRRGTELSLILFDIDHFKSVNDNYGHLAGDEVLQEMGHRILKVIAEHDVFARYGGEEFAILLTDVPIEEARTVAERCREIVEAMPFATSVQPLAITVSVGVASAIGLEQPGDENTLVAAADERLYEAKNAGRNRVCG